MCSMKIGLLLLFAGSPALATPSFPSAIATELGAPLPACEVCHTGTPSRETAVTPFATQMIQRGLSGETSASVKTALAKMCADQVDVGGNGVADVADLAQGRDPNTPARRGCSAAPFPLALLALLTRSAPRRRT